MLVLSVSFVSFSCSDAENLNLLSIKNYQDESLDNFLKLWFIVVATGEILSNNPLFWDTSLEIVEEAKAEWDKLDPIKKAEACTLTFASGEKFPAELCIK
ncbi:hypothetical protein CH365_12465 [Leptospira neocaledonica]|uniref:Uncharacterized protein n=2 Tax=Leptospira neocaledonica TaxID=2023192 RepID=A0A2M9ZY65_9LEPT|nr:hypothetical protein CH365_12465 [Leptospira neocaledonica]